MNTTRESQDLLDELSSLLKQTADLKNNLQHNAKKKFFSDTTPEILNDHLTASNFVNNLDLVTDTINNPTLSILIVIINNIDFIYDKIMDNNQTLVHSDFFMHQRLQLTAMLHAIEEMLPKVEVQNSDHKAIFAMIIAKTQQLINTITTEPDIVTASAQTPSI